MVFNLCFSDDTLFFGSRSNPGVLYLQSLEEAHSSLGIADFI